MTVEKSHGVNKLGGGAKISHLCLHISFFFWEKSGQLWWWSNYAACNFVFGGIFKLFSTKKNDGQSRGVVSFLWVKKEEKKGQKSTQLLYT